MECKNRTVSFLGCNSYLNELIFNPTENSMQLNKISIDQKLHSLLEKIRSTHTTENYSEKSSGKCFSGTYCRCKLPSLTPASHTGQLGSRALTDSAENMKQRQATLETSISFCNQWARAQLHSLTSYHAPAELQ